MITLQPRELEADGIIDRIVDPEMQSKVEYELTDLGSSLAAALLSMRNWGGRLQELEAAAQVGTRGRIQRRLYRLRRTRSLRARSRNACSPPSRMSHTALRICSSSSPPAA